MRLTHLTSCTLIILTLALGTVSAQMPMPRPQGPWAAKGEPTVNVPLDEILRDWSTTDTDAYQRLFVSSSGQRVGVAATAPLFAGQPLEANGAGLFHTNHGPFSVELASDLATPPQLSFADLSTLQLLTHARLIAPALDRAYALTSAPASLTRGIVSYRVGQDALFVSVGAGVCKTGLVLSAPPAEFQQLAPNATVWFEETIELPSGWSIPGLAVNTPRYTTQSTPIVDATGSERLTLLAPVVHDANNVATTDTITSLELTSLGLLVVRTGVAASWLQDSGTVYPVTFDPVLSANQPLIINTTPTVITLTAQPGQWTGVALAGTSADWDLSMGSTTSAVGSTRCDLLVANGHGGPIATLNGEVLLYSGGSGSPASNAVLEQAGVDALALNSPVDYTWTGLHLMHIWELPITAAEIGSNALTVDGPSGLRWYLFQPDVTDTDWRTRYRAASSGRTTSTPKSVLFAEPGVWALVVYRDGDLSVSGNLALHVDTTQSFNYQAEAVTSTASLPVELGSTIGVETTIRVAGLAPPPSTYALYLSTNKSYGPDDIVLQQGVVAAPGTATATIRVPTTVPPGTYHLIVAVDAPNGESITADNEVASSARITVIPTQPGLLQLEPATPRAVTATHTLELVGGASGWQVIAIDSDAGNWTLGMGSVTATADPSTSGLLVAFNPLSTDLSGQVQLGTTSVRTPANSVVGRAPIEQLAVGQDLDLPWRADDVAYGLEIDFTPTGQAGTHTLAVAMANMRWHMRWALFAPTTTTAWTQVASARARGTVDASPITLNLNQAGKWLIVFVRDSGAGESGPVSMRWATSSTPHPFNAVADSVSAVGSAPVTVIAGNSLDIRSSARAVGTPTRGPNYTLYLSSDRDLDTSKDTPIVKGSRTAYGSATDTAVIPANIAAGDYHLILALAAAVGETSVLDNVIASTQVQVTVVAYTPPTGTGGGGGGGTSNPNQPTLNLTQGMPMAVTASANIVVTPEPGHVNIVVITPDVAGERWRLYMGSRSASVRSHPAIMGVDGRHGTIGPDGRISAPTAATSARVEHLDRHPTNTTQTATARWDADDVGTVFELDIQISNMQRVAVTGPRGLRWLVNGPLPTSSGSSGAASWMSLPRGSTTGYPVGPTAQNVYFNAAGIWSIVVYADSGTTVPAGTVSVHWRGPVTPLINQSGFDLEAQEIASPAGLVLRPGDTLPVRVDVANLANDDSPTFALRVVLSADARIDQNDTHLVTIGGLPAVDGHFTRPIDLSATVPGGLVAGNYYVGAFVEQLTGDLDATNGVVGSTTTVRVEATMGTFNPPTPTPATPTAQPQQPAAPAAPQGPQVKGSSGGGGCAMSAGTTRSSFMPLAMLMVMLILVRRRGLRRCSSLAAGRRPSSHLLPLLGG